MSSVNGDSFTFPSPFRCFKMLEHFYICSVASGVQDLLLLVLSETKVAIACNLFLVS